MSRLLWIILGVLGLGLILLIVNNDGGETVGLPNDQFAGTLYYGIWALVVATAVLSSGQQLGELARNAVIWLFAILILSAGYIYRFELQDAAYTIFGGLVPGSAITRVSENGLAEVVVAKNMSGHFQTEVSVDGQPIRMLVDTGASVVVLSYKDAERVGLDVENLQFTTPVSTANGISMAASVRLDEVSIGPISRRNVRAGVLQPGKTSESLLGMNFIETLSSFHMQRDHLVLQD